MNRRVGALCARLSIKNLRDKLLFYHLLEQADWNTGEVKVNVSELERETGWTRWEIKGSLDQKAKKIHKRNHIFYLITAL
ncbi:MULTISPECIES: hypothetical protein [Aneurinibacillus]|uniref:Uncharacterized protein n=1 Tax=Aneurinibacillus thermoaerophilus TaxID=143495 RepID=A0ABX8YBT9_ANETH|nr:MULTISPECIES: hypothetical protein [Aneurinibacillus]MED0677482.1 hypothetical protein [Aneurinibacillus thermoaerophilus]MED0737829.1 hypothetical protein [Aneurinibacillus thermoaerophilus]QYY43092.1 hypothetical protein K3F53_01915 [Aneurinibacillus thermoaerophilus]